MSTFIISCKKIEPKSIVCLFEEGIGLYRLELANSTLFDNKNGFVVIKALDKENREIVLDEQLIEKFNRDPYSFRYLFQ